MMESTVHLSHLQKPFYVYVSTSIPLSQVGEHFSGSKVPSQRRIALHKSSPPRETRGMSGWFFILLVSLNFDNGNLDQRDLECKLNPNYS
jgi:hypothetical protein